MRKMKKEPSLGWKSMALLLLWGAAQWRPAPALSAQSGAGLPILVSARAVPRVQTRSGRRRITPQAGRALEILGHAIEYLTDEFVQQDGMVSSKNERLEAVQMLMALNRQVYYECPEVLSFGERCRALLHLHAR